MTQPPTFETGNREPAADGSPTQPWPAFVPAPPEPPANAYAAPVSPAMTMASSASGEPAARTGSGSSRILNVALGAAIMIGAVGIAFAVGRASAPAAAGGTANTPANLGAVGNRGDTGNAGNNGNGNGNGGGAAGNGGGAAGNGGNLPGASFDLNGNDPNGGPGGPDDIDNGAGFDRGFGRGLGFGGQGISGTVTAVTATTVTIETDNGLTVTFGIDGSTTYHQQAPASASDIKTGTKVQVQPGGGVRPSRDANGNLSLGTAGDVTVVP